ncbi:MAG: gas vesicle protein [Bacillota bacterium]|nr:gas vesicle protein [Bacillota bacterium]
MAVQVPRATSSASLVDLIDRVLDKGLVINADIVVSLVGVELLGIKIRAALASLETAARYGLEFPGGTNYNTEAWKSITAGVEECPQCEKRLLAADLLELGCPWCGWKSARMKAVEESLPLPQLAPKRF